MEAMGGRLGCQPWQLTLREPPMVKELLACMTATERWQPVETGDHFRPKGAGLDVQQVLRLVEGHLVKGKHVDLNAIGIDRLPAHAVRAPAIEMPRCWRVARASRSRSCCSACSCFWPLPGGMSQISAMRVALRRLASSAKPGGRGRHGRGQRARRESKTRRGGPQG